MHEIVNKVEKAKKIINKLLHTVLKAQKKFSKSQRGNWKYKILEKA